MPKPVLVVNYCVNGISFKQAVDNVQQIRDVVEGSGANEDYYTFVLPVLGDSHIQVFYDKDLDKNSFNNIRTIIDQKLTEFGEGLDPNKIIGNNKKGLFTEESHILKRIFQNIFTWKRN